MHQHQSGHTSEELSLSVIGLQVLYNIHKSSQKIVTPNKSQTDDVIVDLPSDNCNDGILPQLFIPNSNQLTFPEVQKEPMCLKVSIAKSVLKTDNSNAKNRHDLKTSLQQNIISSRTSRTSAVSTKRKIIVPLDHQKHRKEISILPAVSKNVDLKIQSGNTKNFPNKKPCQSGFTRLEVSQIIRNNILERTLTSHNNNENHLANQTFSMKKESSIASQSEPICLKFSQNNLVLSSLNQVKNPEGIFKKFDANFKKPVKFNEVEETIKRPELTIEIIDTNFKKPESVNKKSAVTIKKLETCSKKPQVIKPKEQINIPLGNQYDCNHVQNVCLKRLDSKSPPRKLEPSFEIMREPLLQKSESDFIKLESILRRPVTPNEIVEPTPKKLKSLLKVLPKEIKSETCLKPKPLPVIEVGDDAWYETVKNKLYVENELPTDITNIAMQDFSNHSFDASQNASETFNYNDLSSESYMNLDTYLMSPEIQPQVRLNSSQGIVDNNLTFQNSNQVPGLDCSNAYLFFENNQLQISPVNPNENTWSSDGNQVYTELLPVYYS